MASYRRIGAPGGGSGSCCTRSALGQLDAGSSTAALAPEIGESEPRLPLGQLFAVSVAAGLSVFVLSRFLGKDR